MKLKESLIRKGTVLLQTKVKIFLPNESSAMLVVSKKDTVIEHEKAGLEITYLEEIAGTKLNDKDIIFIKGLKKSFDAKHPKTMNFVYAEDSSLTSTDSYLYEFATIIPPKKLEGLDEFVMVSSSPANYLIDAAKSIINNIPIHFNVTNGSDLVKFELDSKLMTEGEPGKSIITMLDPMFFNNYNYSSIGRSKDEALLNFRKDLKCHINLLNLILNEADKEWKNLGSSRCSEVKSEKLE